MNLLFAIACGCPTAFWAKGWSAVQEDPDAVVRMIDSQKDQMRAAIRREFSKDADLNREENAAARALVERAVDPETLKGVVIAAGHSSATPAIRTATMVAGLAQAGLLVGSILLLMRKGTGRALSMLALAAFVAATIATLVKFPPVAEAVGSAVTANLTDSPAYRDLPADQQRELGNGLDHLPQLLQLGVTSVSVVAVVWPVIALLILLVSRGIREACARNPAR
jgi:hypothetical protein